MVKVIAEVANYWQGDFKILHQAAFSAAAAGCSMFKVQLYDTSNMGKEWSGKRAFYKQSELNDIDFKEIANTVNNCGMELLVTVSQIHLLDRALKHTRNIKIASGQLSGEMVGALKDRAFSIDKLVISTGMMHYVCAQLSDIYHLTQTAISEVVVLHCVSLYPPYDVEMNLSRIDSLRDSFKDLSKVKIGYSDHAMDNLPSLVAVSKGIEYLELHFAGRGMWGPTSDIGFDEQELSSAVANFARISRMFGDGDLGMQPREKEVKDKYATRWKNKLIQRTPTPDNPSKIIQIGGVNDHKD